jgi:molecular chaperone GrpE
MEHDEFDPELAEGDVVIDPEFVESNEDGDEIGESAKLKKLQEKIKTLEKEKTEYLDGWQRARADYANLQKTTDEDKKRLREQFAGRFVEDLIPVIDSFNMAMSNKEAWEKVEPTWRMGVEYIYNQLMNALKEHNLETIGEKGDMFDPNLHEAVSEVETGDERYDHRIDQVLQQGYKLGDTVLRAARVVVLKLK